MNRGKSTSLFSYSLVGEIGLLFEFAGGSWTQGGDFYSFVPSSFTLIGHELGCLYKLICWSLMLSAKLFIESDWRKLIGGRELSYLWASCFYFIGFEIVKLFCFWFETSSKSAILLWNIVFFFIRAGTGGELLLGYSNGGASIKVEVDLSFKIWAHFFWVEGVFKADFQGGLVAQTYKSLSFDFSWGVFS